MSHQADGAATGTRRRLAVDRPRHRKRTGPGPLEHPMAVNKPRLDAERVEQRIIERLGLVEIVVPDHHMRKQAASCSRYATFIPLRRCFAEEVTSRCLGGGGRLEVGAPVDAMTSFRPGAVRTSPST